MMFFNMYRLRKFKRTIKFPYNYLSHKEIRAIRVKFKLSQSKFAKILRISIRTYQNWEIGHRIPSGPALALLAHTDSNPEIFIKNLKE
jgi:DNA-binding transcriptional regulator YiaG